MPARMETATSDDDVMQAIARRDGLVFTRVVEDQTAPLYRLAYRMLGDQAEAEDIAQEALLRLWGHASDWRGGGPGIGAWLCRVAMNLCLDRLRRRKFQSDEEAPDRIDDSKAADDMMDEEKMRQSVKVAIGALPDNQRAAIVLTYYQELPNQAAAETLGLNIKAFESLLLRARGALKKQLGTGSQVEG